MELTPQNELNMLKNYINSLPNGPEKNRRKELYQTKKKKLNNAAANAFLLSEFGITTGRTHSPIIKHSSKPNMPTRNLPPLPPGVKGGLRKRKTFKKRKTRRR